MSYLLRSRAAKLAGSVALGLGLSSLGLTALGLLGLALPAGAGKHDAHDWSDDVSSRSRVEGEPFHWSGRLAPGRTIEIHGINGAIEASLASGREATVEASKSGRKSDPDEVKIEVIERPDGILVCARYPRPDGELNDCDGKHSETRNNDVVVRFKVAVPAGVSLVAHTVNGGIDIDDLKGDVEAMTVNGGIRVSTSGTASATTVNGSVNARIGSDLHDDLEFTSVNGRVLVEMPRSVNADIRGSTVHGAIYSDFPLNVRGRNFNRRIDGRIGRGGHDLTLSTVNGTIELRSLGGSRGRRSVVQEDQDDEDDDEDDDSD